MYRVSLRFKTWTFCQSHQCEDCHSPFRLGDYDLVLQWLQGCRTDSLAMSTLLKIVLQFSGHIPTNIDDEKLIRQIAWLVSSGRLHLCAAQQEQASTGSVISHTSSSTTQSNSQTSSQASTAQTPSQSQAPTSSSSQTSSNPSTSSATNTTLSSQTSITAQVEALKSAAETGKAFCEECEKAKEIQPSTDVGKANSQTINSNTQTTTKTVELVQSSFQTTASPATLSNTKTVEEPVIIPSSTVKITPLKSSVADTPAKAQAQALKAAAESGKPFCEECEKAKEMA